MLPEVDGFSGGVDVSAPAILCSCVLRKTSGSRFSILSMSMGEGGGLFRVTEPLISYCVPSSTIGVAEVEVGGPGVSFMGGKEPDIFVASDVGGREIQAENPRGAGNAAGALGEGECLGALGVMCLGAGGLGGGLLTTISVLLVEINSLAEMVVTGFEMEVSFSALKSPYNPEWKALKLPTCAPSGPDWSLVRARAFLASYSLAH